MTGMTARPSLDIRPMLGADAVAIARQPSQLVQLGLEIDTMDPAIAADLATNGEAWTAWRGGLPIACMGIRETFPDAQGIAWAVLSQGIGAAHLAITRFARARIVGSRLARIEAIVRSDVDVEAILRAYGPLDAQQLLDVVLALDRAAEPRWAKCVGLDPCVVLRKFGAASEPHILYSRIH